MATKKALRGAFNSLSDTLASRFSPSFPEDVAGRWLGVMVHAAAVGRRISEWHALPDSSDQYDAVIKLLSEAANALAAADEDHERMAALNLAEAALDSLDRLLDNPPA